MDSDEDENIDFDNVEFENERAVAERVSGRMYGTGDDRLDKFDPTTAFRNNVEAISRDIKTNHPRLLGNDDIEFLQDKINTLDKPGYKNASCYILGYIATNESKESIDKVRLDFAHRKIVPELVDTSIEKADIIRYGNLWIKYLY
jgi:hypothetical protein